MKRRYLVPSLTALAILLGASGAQAGFWDDVMSWGGHTGTTVNGGWLNNNMGHNTWYNEQVYLRHGYRDRQHLQDDGGRARGHCGGCGTIARDRHNAGDH